MNLSRLFAGAAALGMIALSTASFAADIMVADPWARASAGKVKNGAAFMTLMNHGHDDRLVSAAADVSKTVELHTHIHDKGVMRMRQVEAIELPAHGKAELKPGGYHVMFMGLNAPLKEGESFELTLTFEKAGEVNVTVPVKKAGAMGGHGKHGGHGHKH